MARIKAKAEKLHQEALAQAEKIQAAEVIELSAKKPANQANYLVQLQLKNLLKNYWLKQVLKWIEKPSLLIIQSAICW